MNNKKKESKSSRGRDKAGRQGTPRPVQKRTSKALQERAPRAAQERTPRTIQERTPRAAVQERNSTRTVQSTSPMSPLVSTPSAIQMRVLKTLLESPSRPQKRTAPRADQERAPRAARERNCKRTVQDISPTPLQERTPRAILERSSKAAKERNFTRTFQGIPLLPLQERTLRTIKERTPERTPSAIQESTLRTLLESPKPLQKRTTLRAIQEETPRALKERTLRCVQENVPIPLLERDLPEIDSSNCTDGRIAVERIRRQVEKARGCRGRGRGRGRPKPRVVRLPPSAGFVPLQPTVVSQIVVVSPMRRCSVNLPDIQPISQPQPVPVVPSPTARTLFEEPQDSEDSDCEWPEDLQELVADWDKHPIRKIWDIINWFKSPMTPAELQIYATESYPSQSNPQFSPSGPSSPQPVPVPELVASVQEMLEEWEETFDNKVDQVLEWLGYGHISVNREEQPQLDEEECLPLLQIANIDLQDEN